MSIKLLRTILPAVTISFILLSCGGGSSDGGADGSAQVVSKRAGVNEVILHESANPDKIMPALSTSANSTYVEGMIFMALLDIDPRTYEYNPSLAESRPEMTENANGGWDITYRLRPEARWDNGEPVTAKDVDFTLKFIKNPMVNCEHLRGYYEFITDIKFYEEDPLKFTFITKDKYFMSEIWSAVTVYPEYNYDPEQLMRKFTLAELSDPSNTDRLRSDPDINAFANNIHEEKYAREKGFISGSGPYAFESFETGQRVTLLKKENWWGDAIDAPGFDAHPKKLIFEIITDQTTSITAMKDENLDVMRGVKAKDFEDLKKDDKFNSLYRMADPIGLSYSYIGLNMKHPILSDKLIRQALALAIDKQYVIDVLMYGYGIPTIGPINPSKPYYNKDIEGYGFDLKRAKDLLTQAGWTDSDGDGILDKQIDGQLMPLKLTMMYSQGSDVAENIGLTFRESLKKIGVSIELISKEWTVFLDQTKSHNFDMYLGGWVAAPTLADLKQIWHTQSYNGGSNYVGFGNSQSDELIEKIRYENDEAVRNPMYMEIQEIIHDEVPYIFLFASKQRICIHKRFDNAEGMVARPGYVVNEFKLNPAFGVAQAAQ